ncbi:MAG: hypothetical protein JW803_05005 [Endomicrobiales bacterium]|nr:hypothetical protein [Endomicrobiales bacterium]
MSGIDLLIGKARIRLLASRAAEYASGWLLWNFSALVLWILCDLIFVLDPLSRKSFYFASAAILLAWLLRFARSVSGGRLSEKNILVLVGERAPDLGDGLVSSWQLSRAGTSGVSRELIETHGERINEKIRRTDLGAVIPLVTKKTALYLKVIIPAVFLAGTLVCAPPGVLRAPFLRVAKSLFPADWREWLAVEPRSASVPSGSAVTVKLEKKQAIQGIPRLWIRTERGPWTKNDFTFAGKGSYYFEMEKIVSETEYYAVLGDIETERFVLKPVTFPKLGNFRISVLYPSYTGLTEPVFSENPNISAPAGSTVRIAAESDKPLAGVAVKTSWGARPAVKRGKRKLDFSFTISKDGDFRILAVGADGARDPDPARYQVSVLRDDTPDVRIVSPDGDLLVSEGAGIPVIISASDDFGVTGIDVVYRIDGAGERRINVAKYHAAREFSVNLEHILKPSSLGVRPGGKIAYYAQAFDNDTVSGPKSSVSAPRNVEVTDSMNEHEKIEAGVKDLRDSLLNLLADQMQAREKTEKLEVRFSSRAYSGALELQKRILDNARKGSDGLSELVSRMERDPYTDFSTFSEYRGMKSHLDYVRDDLMQKAQDALERKDFSGAGLNQKEAVAELEKISLLAEDIFEYQKMRDLLASADDLHRRVSDFKSALNDSRDGAAMKDAYGRIQELLEKINVQLSRLGSELPEDFVNSPAVKKIDMNEYRDLSKRLEDAIENGNLEEAGKLAEEFEKSLKNLSEMLDLAGKNIGFSSSLSAELSEKIERYRAELSRIIDEQEQITSRTEKLNSLYEELLNREQEKLFPELARKQKKLVNSAESSREAFLKAGTWKMGETLKLMSKVLEEFEGKRAFNSQKYLKDIIDNMEEAKKRVEKDEPLSAKAAGIANGEKEILEILKNETEQIPFGPSDRKKMGELKDDQSRLSRDTRKLRESAGEFTRKSMLMDPSVFMNLKMAEYSMNGAASGLSEEKIPSALENSRLALEYLKGTGEAFQSAGSGLSDMQKKAGTPVTGLIKIKRGGMTGFSAQPVKLPGIEDYKPPREFRQEIMEALREKYPQEYEKMIKEYYRKLTE